jgi:Domain of unknown function (DUF4157)
MRMPWQRRSARRAKPDEVSTPEATRQAWRSLPPLEDGFGVRPPLTAQSAELADALSLRLRSTRQRSPLIHRSGLPAPAAGGTVRGIVTAVPQRHRTATALQTPTGDDLDTAPPATTVSPSKSSQPRVVARPRPVGSLTTIDPALAAWLRRPPERQVTAQVEDAISSDNEDQNATPPAHVVPQRTQRTVIRRRGVAGSVRTIGLQAPFPDDPAEETPAVRPREAETPQGSVPERAPSVVAAAVGRIHRANVSDVQVERGKQAERLAASANALAVTRGGEVFIPESEGRLDTGRGGGLLAHELTHVIQQRRLGGSVPLEHSPRGRRLEAEAAMTERHVRGDLGAPAPAPAIVEPQPQPKAQPESEPAARGDSDDPAAATARDIQEELVASGRAIRMPDGALVFPGSGAHLREQRSSPVQPAVAIQRASEEATPGGPPDAPAEQPQGNSGTVPVLPPTEAAATSTPPTARIDMAPPPRSGWDGPQPTAHGAPPGVGASQMRLPAPSDIPAVVAPEAAGQATEALPDRADAPAVDLDDLARRVYGQLSEATPGLAAAPAFDLDDLAHRVYGHVRTQLRSELLIDRERAGLLTDFR